MDESISSENCIDSSSLESGISSLPDEVLAKILGFLDCPQYKSSVSLVCKNWYNSERFIRTHVHIRNCYAVSPEIVVGRFPNIRSVTLKGKPSSADYSLVPDNWGANIHPWLVCFANVYPFLEELRLKRMSICDDSLKLLAMSFPNFKRLSLELCDGFSTDGLSAIATHCNNLVELDIDDNIIEERSGSCWLSFFPESFTSMEILKFSNLRTEVSFDSLERLVSMSKSLRVLKVDRHNTPQQLHRLLVLAPRLTQLGASGFSEEFLLPQYADLESVFKNYKSLETLSLLGETHPLYYPLLYPVCMGLTFLNLSDTLIHDYVLAQVLGHCPNLRRLWIVDIVGDEGMEAIGFCCPLLEELRVYPIITFGDDVMIHGITETGFLAVSNGCPNLRYVHLFCKQMTNAAVSKVVENCPHFTHFRLCINTTTHPRQPDHLTNGPFDEAFGSVVKTCKKLKRLSISGLLTDLAFEYIGKYAKNLKTLSVGFAGDSDYGMQCVLEGCPKLRRLQIRDCPFGNAGLLSGLDRYESMRSLWMSSCNVTMGACQVLASKMPRLNVEVMNDDVDVDVYVDDKCSANRVYVYPTVVGPRKDAPPFVLLL